MTTPSNKCLLDRDTIDQFVAINLSPTIGLLRELVDYGVDLLDKCGQHGGSLSDLVIKAHFFKHAVTMLDAIEIQLSRGAVFSANVSARSMLETYIYLKWILETDTERRGRQFYVWYLSHMRTFVRRFLPNTPEYNHFNKQLSTLSDMKDLTKRTALEKDAKKQDADITALLTNKNNNLINNYFDKLKRKNYDVAWYRPAGPHSIRDMTKQLKLESEYYYFYSQFSNITHTGAFEKHVKFNGKAVVFEPIRSPEGIDILINVVVTLTLRVFILIIKKYFPKELKQFTQNYKNRWRGPFLSLPNVVVRDKAKDNLKQTDVDIK